MSYFLPQPRGNTLIKSLLILLHSSVILAQTCYFPSGDPATEFTPCNGTAGASHCCKKSSDACLTSGLCYMKWDHSINTGTCTDKTWRDPSCFQLCPKTTAYKTEVTNTLYRCNGNNWCCSAGGNTTSCCNDPGIDLFNVGQAEIFNGSAWAPGFTLVPVEAVQTRTSTSSGSVKSCPTATVFTKINATAASASDQVDGTHDDDDHQDTKKVRLAVGFGIGLPLLVALSSVIFLLWREKRSHQALRQQISAGYPQPVNPNTTYGWKKPYEICAREDEVREMPTGPTGPTGGEIVPELHEGRLGR